MNKNSDKTIYIVSGLPRSGTSMLMQILEAGGIEIFTDEKREPNKDNPRGYYEYEKVKSLEKDNSWVGKSQGKAIKVIAQLLKYLPDEFEYKIIFMHRNVDEVIMSQQKMLGKDPEENLPRVKEIFEEQVKEALNLIEQKDNMEVLEVDHRNVIKNTEEVVSKIQKFLDLDMDTKAMTDVVDPSLHRNKAS